MICQPEAVWMDDTVHSLDQYPRCPSVEALLRFALGESLEAEQLEVAAHLRTCSACRDEVDWTRMTFPPAPAEEPVFAAIRRVVATLFSPQAAPSIGLRGDADPGSMTTSTRLYKTEDLEITLSIESEGDASYLVSGEILRTQSAAQVPGVESMVLLYLLSDDLPRAQPALVAEASVTSGNDFDLHDIPAGAYRLDLIYGDEVIALQPVSVP
jgi:hypothetical protein